MRHIIIIGNGIAGVTCARHIRKQSNDAITIISSETKYFFSRPALMYVYMGDMKFEHTKPYEDNFWKKNKINLVEGFVHKIDSDTKTVFLKEGASLRYDVLVLASGSVPNFFGWKGQNLEGVQGFYSYRDIQLLEKKTKNITSAVIVGGGLIGIELCEMLLSRNIKVVFLVREKSFWNIVLPPEESEMINKHIQEHHIELRLSTELQEIVSKDGKNLSSIITKENEEIECQLVGITVGVRPNIDFLKTNVPSIKINKGILVDIFLQTNIPDIYAIGDCAEVINPLPNRRAIEAVWYVGKIMGETVAQTICSKPTQYNPGVWFNSAKFLDIEYQTYGSVKPILEAGEDTFWWQHEKKHIGMRFVFSKTTRTIIGVNVMGMRQRHETWNKWIKEEKTIEYVMEHLQEARFDPEFFANNEKYIQKAFASYHKSIK